MSLVFLLKYRLISRVVKGPEEERHWIEITPEMMSGDRVEESYCEVSPGFIVC